MRSGEIIVTRQAEPEQLMQLAAKKELYMRENWLQAGQMVIAALTALVGAIVQYHVKGAQPIVAVVAAGLSLCDVLLVDGIKGQWQQLAASVQEQFDCYVLSLPWRKLKAGREPEPEVTLAYCKRFYENPDELRNLANWYPVVVKDIPLQPARIICQRENCYYDTILRKRYIILITIVLIALSTFTVVIGMLVNHSFVDSLASMVAPLVPAYIVGLREIMRHTEGLNTSRRLFDYIEELYENAVNKSVSDDELDDCSRFLQDEIFDNRRRAPVIFEWVYKWLRDKNEQLVARSAAELVEQYKRKNG